MSKNPINPGGDIDASSGSGEGEGDGKPNDTVQYATYQKVLAEKKKRDVELSEARKMLDDMQAKEKAASENDLKAKEEFKKLVEIRDVELASEKQKRSDLEGQIQSALKMDSFLKALSGKVDDVYLGLVPVEDIVIDPSTGRPDMASVQEVVKNFESKFSKVIERASGKKLPNDAAGGSKQTLTHDDWLKLPVKEMRKRIGEVIKQ